MNLSYLREAKKVNEIFDKVIIKLYTHPNQDDRSE